VTISWSAARGATSYRVYRDGTLVEEVATTSCTDGGAASGGAPPAPLLVASDGTFTDRVELIWSAPTPSAGAAHAYTVTAVNAAGESAPSESDEGFRAAHAVTTYELSMDGGAYADVGFATTAADFAAAAGSVTAGTVTASDGASTAHVALAIAGAGASRGAARTYAVRAVSAAGAGAPSEAVTGRRGVGPLAYQWQRSAADADAG
jgi:hypothetical protein